MKQTTALKALESINQILATLSLTRQAHEGINQGILYIRNELERLAVLDEQKPLSMALTDIPGSEIEKIIGYPVKGFPRLNDIQ